MPAPVSEHIIVVIRFSYVARSGFRVNKLSEREVRAQLYADQRLARRFAMFEALTLPSLRAQTDQDFTTVVVIGDDFPAGWRARLESLLHKLGDGRVVALPPQGNYGATKAALTSCLHDRATHVVSMRLDDDDALGRNCIAETRRIVPLLHQISGPGNPAVIAFNKGLFLEMGPERNQLYGVVEKLPLGIGMSMVAPRDARPTIFSLDHRQVHTRFNCYTDGVNTRFIRTVHRDNDSAGFASGRRIDFSDAELDKILTKSFPFARPELLALRP
ncbi:MAG: hypothetical protein JJT99_13590 [Rhodobacteraceae bacterium]|nr:hypothetical protein [Paracoccaceae bacterium]